MLKLSSSLLLPLPARSSSLSIAAQFGPIAVSATASTLPATLCSLPYSFTEWKWEKKERSVEIDAAEGRISKASGSSSTRSRDEVGRGGKNGAGQS